MAEETLYEQTKRRGRLWKRTNGANGTNGPNGYLSFSASTRRNPSLIRVLPEPVQNGTVLEGVRKKVFLDRYSLKDEEGNPLEEYLEQMWRRVARAIAQVEETAEKRQEWEEKFYRAMEDFKFVPGGRILSGAGTGFAVTYYNCYVLPSPKDSRDGILDNLKEMIEIMARGGGVGINLSTLRPRGARVKKVNGFSSGPMNWAALHSTATRDIVQQGGTRRGALMLMLWDWHPDIEEFITVKEDLTKIQGANLSVCVSDRFMKAVREDKDWDLVFPDLDDPEYDEKWDGILKHWQEAGKKVKVYKTVKARYLWDLICKAAWASAEPGVVFMERYNKWHNNYYFNYINCVNPCVTGDTRVATSQGVKTMLELHKEGKPFLALVDGKTYLSTAPFKTGVEKVYRLKTKEGYELRLTKDHKVYTVKGKREAGSLKRGDKILLSRNGGAFGAYGTLEEGRVWGWLVGDGAVKKDVATLFFYGEEKRELAPQFAYMVNGMIAQEGVTRREYPVAAQYVEKEDKAVVESVRLWRIAQRLGFAHGNKYIVPDKIFAGSEELQRGFLQGLFSSDGHVAGTPQNGVSVRLTSVSRSLLVDVQKLLLNFGIVSKIYANRRVAQKRLLPDGRGGKKAYSTKAYHDLVISKSDVEKFAALVGFLQEEKQEKLRSCLALYARGPYRSSFIATFDRLEQDDVEEVFDITVSQIHKFAANGLIVSNCGEEGLPAYGVCNLGSLNLSNFVVDGEMDYESLAEHAKVAVRFQDNVIDGDVYALPGIVEAQLNGERRIGLGTMGLGDALIKMKLRYGSQESLPVIEKIYKMIRDAAYEASVDIAAEKGAFAKFDRAKYLQAYFIKKLPARLRKQISKHGIRNSILLMQAPTGSTSLLSGTTSGIEPVYEFSFIRRDRLGEHKIYHPLYDEWRKEHPEEERPDYFVSANDLSPEDHVRVQAAVQKYVDASISKTVNAPKEHTVEDVKKLYTLAYELGCKGITYMRDSSRPGVLSRDEKEKHPLADVIGSKEKEEGGKSEVIEVSQGGSLTSPRPEKVIGATYRVVTPIGAIFVTINEDENGNPFEVFINGGKGGSDIAAMAEALGRSISTILRMNAQAAPRMRLVEIVDQLSGIGGRRSIGFGANKVRSLPDAVALALAKHFGLKTNGNGNGSGGETGQSGGDEPASGEPPREASAQSSAEQSNGASPNMQAGAVMAAHNPDPTPAPAALDNQKFASADICPECGAGALVHEEGCAKCYACGHAEC